MRAFLSGLWEDGRAAVAVDEPSPAEREEAASWLEERSRFLAADLPGPRPPFRPEAAQWGALQLWQGCRALAFPQRRLIARSALEQPAPFPLEPGALWSVDLSLRWLPDLLRLAPPQAAPGLAETLRALGARWPLSSVGMGLPGAALDRAALDCLLADPALRGLYLDRVLASGELDRLTEPALRDAAEAALGLHPDLDPALAAWLARPAEAT